jgi:molybdate transport system substrate-binding protein
MQPTPAHPRRSIRHRRWLMAAALTAWFAGPPAAAADTTLQVFAASSLTEVFEDLARGFEAAQPTIAVQLTLGGSQALRLQIEQGADVDVFASADERHMVALIEIGDVEESLVFARNDLVVIVPLDDPAGIETFADLPRAMRIVIGAESVPVGAYTRTVLAHAGERFGEAFSTTVWDHVVSEESNVRLVRAKVELGEADAAPTPRPRTPS